MLFMFSHIVIKIIILYFVIRIILKKLQGKDLSNTTENIINNFNENIKSSAILSQIKNFINDIYEYHRKQLFVSIIFLIFSYIFIQISSYLKNNQKIKKTRIYNEF